VLDYDTISDLLKHTGLNLNHKVVINLTNGTPKQARTMDQYMRETVDVRAYFDGAVMTTPVLLATEASFIYLSGETVSQHRF
jgi:hypothetical protein